MQLNPFQERAVRSSGHCTILACPGSGKTRVLSERAAHLIKSHELGRLCAVTFTRDAANELRTRILESCGQEHIRRLGAGTFHSLALEQLKRSSRGRPPRLMGDGERWAVLRRCWQEEETDVPFDDVCKLIDKAKSQPGHIAFADVSVQRIYERYSGLLHSEQVMDFSDILLSAVHGMQDGSVSPLPIRWLLVDEAQDMDAVQLEWILNYGRKGVEVTLVGDDDQSLYSFRHALGYGGLQEASLALSSLELTLPVNYRCAPNILDAAARLIVKNPHRAHKNIQAAKLTMGVLEVQRTPTRADEVSLIAHTVAAPSEQHWAVLGRTNTILDSVELALTKLAVGYTRVGGKSIWDRAVGSVFLGLLRSLADGSWTGVANALVFCRVDATWVNEHSRTSEGHYLDRLDQALAAPQDERRRKVLTALREGFISWATQLSKDRLPLVAEAIADLLCGYAPTAQIPVFKALADSFGGLRGSLPQRVDFISRGGSSKNGADLRVQLVTLHSSKGLEFDNVWIMGCEEGNLPHTDSTEEEERRLMYVGMTRAKQRLVISSALQEGAESRFLEEAGI